MKNEQKPVRCGCGGGAHVGKYAFYCELPLYKVRCVCYGLKIKPERPYDNFTRKSRYQNTQTVECAKWSKFDK